MRGLLFYHQQDVVRNRRFIELLTHAAQRRGAELTLVIAEQLEAREADEWSFALLDARGNRVFLEKPDFAIMRTRDAALTGRVERAGVRAFNNSAVCAMANDKRRTYEAFSGKVPMMRTWRIPEDTSGLQNWPPRKADYPLVVKPAGGHGGAGVALARDFAQLEELLAACPGGAVVQPLCSEPGRDLRVYVLGGEILCGVMREAKGEGEGEFRSNFSLGGSAKLHTLSEAERGIVEKVLREYSFDLAGIDLIYHEGGPVLNEIEDVVGCRMLYALTDMDIADRYLAYILKTIQESA